MKDYLIRLAINYAHVYPWEKEKNKGLLLLSKEEIDNILQEEELNTVEKRREIGWKIEKIMYMNAVNAKNVEDLKEKIGNQFIKFNYKTKILPRDLINETLKRKKLLLEHELELYKKLIAGKLTEDDYNIKSVCVQTWFTDILAKYYITSDNQENASKDGVLKFIARNIEGRFYKGNYKTKTIGDYLAHSGFNTKPVIQLYRKLFIVDHKDFTNLLKTAPTFESEKKTEPKRVKLDSFLDEISQLLGVKEEDSNIVDKSIVEEIVETLPNIEIIEDKKVKSEYEVLMDKYEELVCQKEKEKQILENKMCDFLRKLVAPEEGAVLSELYSLYVNFEKTDKDNIGAALSNFFNKLMFMELEVKEDGKKEGDMVRFHSSELLKTYRVLRAINQEGTIEGTIKYVGWDYAGKTLMQPVVRVNSK